MSPVIWLILAGLVAIWLFMLHVQRLDAAGGEPLVTPSLFGNRQMTGGLVMFFFQFVVMMGLFFVDPAVPVGRPRALGDRDRASGSPRSPSRC